MYQSNPTWYPVGIRRTKKGSAVDVHGKRRQADTQHAARPGTAPGKDIVDPVSRVYVAARLASDGDQCKS